MDKHFFQCLEKICVAVRSRSKTFLLEGLWSGLLEKTRSGDVIFVQFGHNDSHAPDRYESTDSETDYKDCLRTYADDAAAAGASLIFVTPPHRRLFNADGTIARELLPYANSMKAVAQKSACPQLISTACSERICGNWAKSAAFCSSALRKTAPIFQMRARTGSPG